MIERILIRLPVLGVAVVPYGSEERDKAKGEALSILVTIDASDLLFRYQREDSVQFLLATTC
jgi:hypothetical protein